MQEQDAKTKEIGRIPILNISSEIENYLMGNKAKNIQPKLK